MTNVFCRVPVACSSYNGSYWDNKTLLVSHWSQAYSANWSNMYGKQEWCGTDAVLISVCEHDGTCLLGSFSSMRWRPACKHTTTDQMLLTNQNMLLSMHVNVWRPAHVSHFACKWISNLRSQSFLWSRLLFWSPACVISTHSVTSIVALLGFWMEATWPQLPQSLCRQEPESN